MKPAFIPRLAESIKDSGVVAVLVIDHEDDAPRIAEALLKGGINAIELTLRTPAALPALKRIRQEFPDIIAGVGTILSPDQVDAARDAGGAFGVSPGVSRRVLARAAELEFSFAPGIMTPSDIEASLEFDCRLLKFFPAEPSGGLPFLRVISAPYAHLGIRFLPLGGLNSQNMSAYLSDPLVAALGGSWLAPRDVIAAKDWNKITEVAAQTVKTIHASRNS
jgi:2-dehydro-3-deoxyphosphogluconate aldolase/(4S)-4-hydroxy-2-oxoglutarate aldolase